MFYKEGIFVDSTCENGRFNLDHGVLLVGYGREPSGMPIDFKDFWIIKNRLAFFYYNLNLITNFRFNFSLFFYLKIY